MVVGVLLQLLATNVAAANQSKLDMFPRLLRRIPAAHVATKPQCLATRALHTSPVLRAIDMAKVDTTERLAELRKLMKERNVDVYSTVPRSRGHSKQLY